MEGKEKDMQDTAGLTGDSITLGGRDSGKCKKKAGMGAQDISAIHP